MSDRIQAWSVVGVLVLGLTLQSCAPDGGIGRWTADAASATGPEDAEPDAAEVDDGDAGCGGDAGDASSCRSVSVRPFVPEELTVRPGLWTTYFAEGRDLPAGDYVLRYVDGCWKSGVVSWTVNVGLEGYTLVGGPTKQRLLMAPGTVGTFTNLGAYATYEECIAANQGQPSVAFHFDGGVLGLDMYSLDPITLFVLVAGGETVGGRSPTFQLRCDGVCR